MAVHEPFDDDREESTMAVLVLHVVGHNIISYMYNVN